MSHTDDGASSLTPAIKAIADRLMLAEQSRIAIAPLGESVAADDVAMAYAIQGEVVRRRLNSGRRRVGRKIGLTSAAVQAQMGVNQPDFGILFADMEICQGESCTFSDLIQPRIEAEIAFVLGRDLQQPDVGVAEVLRAVDFAIPALEIVDSRIADWKITIVDTIADNGSSARFVLGMEPRRLTDLDILTAGMVLTRDDTIVSVGSGAACLGHPLNSALWLARTMAALGTPLREGDVLLTGALGPMVSVAAGQRFEASIGGFAPVSVRFT